ncbi:hypothetical protein M199_gp236 [Halogranum tailed virus 1]|uniref:Uncharacterized protein n=1 Tax=Halogranum tailed virus 1 TaxID=1273749 RepID=R4T960_9CAUD|nr:hypothetical protein M199_gp236 [Halogranum tailed virus 1]AGM11430.1 hypothetical protein HGTV1_132 [Halogranum tailed virus 1]
MAQDYRFEDEEEAPEPEWKQGDTMEG